MFPSSSSGSGAVCRAWRVIGLNAITLLAAGWSMNAKADCQISQGINSVDVAVFSINLGALPSFDPMQPDGKILATAESRMGNSVVNIHCTPSVGDVVYSGIGIMEGRFRTFPTSVSGIGVRVGIANGESTWWWENYHSSGGQGINFIPDATLRVQLVKTGPITAGGFLSGDIAQMRLVTFDRTAILIKLAGSVPIKPLVPACETSTVSKNIDVPLGSVSEGTLKEDPASAAKSFNVQLKCSGGTQGATTRMYMGMTDANTPGNSSDVLTLSANSNAKGVGVRILRDGATAVRFTPDASISGGPNQWHVGQFGNEVVDIPFTAYFVPTGDPIIAGTANAAATYTIDYQ